MVYWRGRVKEFIENNFWIVNLSWIPLAFIYYQIKDAFERKRIREKENKNAADRINFEKAVISGDSYYVKEYVDSHNTYYKRCWSCKRPIISLISITCPKCGWYICPHCGTCHSDICSNKREIDYSDKKIKFTMRTRELYFEYNRKHGIYVEEKLTNYELKLQEKRRFEVEEHKRKVREYHEEWERKEKEKRYREEEEELKRIQESNQVEMQLEHVKVGETINHIKYGVVQVIETHEDRIVILFQGQKKKIIKDKKYFKL